ncbi:MAG: serine/threonine protein kinase [Sandaracinaceae bacterium]|nr:serine/threonine protein kinase [Sandaracinaceae bacterium]
MPSLPVDDLAKTIESQGHDATVDRNPRLTIEPRRQDLDSLVSEAIGALTRRSVSQRYSELDVLGEGGMGVVRLGQQRSLERPVALKSLKSGLESPSARLKLLREAWITGKLEHPNIVPVHDLGIDERGEPRIVLKRIEGASWDSLFANADDVKRRFDASDLLDWNLRVLLEVAHALHFAHTRGIVHRDLKPENVMIGSFGEVYVVDWGLAVALEDDGTARLPLAKDALELAGTPSYMAPEQWGGSREVGVRTDVYLLGATLYEILVGAPPRDGRSLAELAAKSLVSPALPESVPEPLAQIVIAAMQPRVEDRLESAEAFRRALSTYLSRRSSIELARDAIQRVEQLEAMLSAREIDRVAIYQAFGAARFGFLEALRTWKDNEVARDGLTRAVRAMIDFELAHGDPLAAQALLADAGADPVLAQRVASAVDAHRQEQEELRATQRDYDPSLGRRTRWFVSVVFGTVWTIVPIGLYALQRADLVASTHLGHVVTNILLCIFGAGLFYWARESMTRTAINRGIVGVMTAAIIAQILVSVGCWIADIPTNLVLVLYFAVWTGVAGAAVATIEARLWPSMVVFGACFLAGTYAPEYRHLLASLGNAVLALNTTFLWSRLDEDLVEVRRRLGGEHGDGPRPR